VADSKRSVNAAGGPIANGEAEFPGPADLSTIPVDNTVDFTIRLPAVLLIPPLFSLCLKKVQLANVLILNAKSKVKQSPGEYVEKLQYFRHQREIFRRLCTTLPEKAVKTRFCKGLRGDLKSTA